MSDTRGRGFSALSQNLQGTPAAPLWPATFPAVFSWVPRPFSPIHSPLWPCIILNMAAEASYGPSERAPPANFPDLCSIVNADALPDVKREGEGGTGLDSGISLRARTCPRRLPAELLGKPKRGPPTGVDLPGHRSCKYCSFVARYPSALTQHERIHTGDKPFKCRGCGFSSAQKCHVERHEIRHKHVPHITQARNQRSSSGLPSPDNPTTTATLQYSAPTPTASGYYGAGRLTSSLQTPSAFMLHDAAFAVAVHASPALPSAEFPFKRIRVQEGGTSAGIPALAEEYLPGNSGMMAATPTPTVHVSVPPPPVYEPPFYTDYP